MQRGSRFTDHVSLGAIARFFSTKKVTACLESTGTASRRQRLLPAHVVLYYVLALTLFRDASCREVLRCLLDGMEWFAPGNTTPVRVAGRSAISRARKRLGAAPLLRLYELVVKPIAKRTTKGARYRRWALVSIDGTTLDVADTKANEQAFGRPGVSRGRSGFPQLRFVTLVENGTHVLFGARLGSYNTGETTLASKVFKQLTAGMLCLADRGFFGYKAWRKASSTKADLLWRGKTQLLLPCRRRLPDGSYISTIYPSTKARRQRKRGIRVRVVEYKLLGAPKAQPVYRLLTTILNHEDAPAHELAALYHERWEIETALDELKTHLRGPKVVMRSKTPELVRQEFYGLLLTHFAIRGLMHEAALEAKVDPDTLSFTHAVRVVRRKLNQFVAITPEDWGRLHDRVMAELLEERVSSSRGRTNPRALKRNVGKFPIKAQHGPTVRPRVSVRIVK